MLGFCFSKKRVDSLAQALSRMSLIGAKEASTSTHFFDNAVSRLHPDDQALPQILRIRELLGRGIAVHHAGDATVNSEWVARLGSKQCMPAVLECMCMPCHASQVSRHRQAGVCACMGGGAAGKHVGSARVDLLDF